MKEMVTNVVNEKQLRLAQLRALKLFSDTIEKTYGPMGGLTIYSKQNSQSKHLAVSSYTKDGFTVLKNIQVDKPIESLLKEELIDICVHVLKKIGDGTSSAVILSYLIFNSLIELEKKGYKKRLILKTFKEILDEAIEIINRHAEKCTLNDIYWIALTSLNNNTEMAKIIADIYNDYGENVFIDVYHSNTEDTVVKGYDGLNYDSGFLDGCFINNPIDKTCDLYNPHIYIFDNPIDTPEMLGILEAIIRIEIVDKYQHALKKQQEEMLTEDDIPNQVLIIAPFISRDANSYLDQLISSFMNVPPEQRHKLCIVSNFTDPNRLIDIMKMTGAKFIKKYIDPNQYEIDLRDGLAPTEANLMTFAGKAEKVVIDAVSTKIINPVMMRNSNGELTAYYHTYIDELEAILTKYIEKEENSVKIGDLKRRIHILKGNMVDLIIGGIGTADKDSLRDSVEDAVLNCRSAIEDGVGYGANFEGLRAFINLASKYKIVNKDKLDVLKIKADVSSILAETYIELCTKIYKPYTNDDKLAKLLVLKSVIDQEDKAPNMPYNLISETYDNHIKSSIKTEISVLEAISKIISTMFNTNQFLVPEPRFNIYDWEEKDNNREGITMSIDNTKKEDSDVPDEEEL